MEALIRAAAVSSVAFELRRPAARGDAPAGRGAAVQPAATPAPAAGAAPSPATAAKPAPSTVATPAAPAAAPAQRAPAASASPAGVSFVAAAPAARPAAMAQAATVQAAAVPAQSAAQQEAARLAMQAELAELRAEAERRGHAAGLEKGVAEGRGQLQAHVQRLDDLASRLARMQETLHAQAEDNAVELAYAAVCRILGAQAATREGIQAMVTHCASSMREREQIEVRLHPDDFALLGEADARQLRFVPAPEVALGGCIVDSSTGSLDARLETQLRNLADTLLAVRRARRHEGDVA